MESGHSDGWGEYGIISQKASGNVLDAKNLGLKIEPNGNKKEPCVLAIVIMQEIWLQEEE